MKAKKRRILRKIIALSMVAMMLSAPMTPLANVVSFGTSITASANESAAKPSIITTEAELANVKVGDIICPTERIDLKQSGSTMISLRNYYQTDSGLYNFDEGFGSTSNISYFGFYIGANAVIGMDLSDTTYVPCVSQDTRGNAWRVVEAGDTLKLEGVKADILRVSSFEELDMAINTVGADYIILDDDIESSTNNDLTINNECTIDFNHHGLYMVNDRRLTISEDCSSCTFKNGYIESVTNGRDAAVHVLADTTFDNMFVVSNSSDGHSTLKFGNDCNVVIKDTTIVANSDTGRGIAKADGGLAKSISFYGNVNISTYPGDVVCASIYTGDVYLYGKLSSSSPANFCDANLYFRGGSIKNPSGGNVVINSDLCPQNIYLEGEDADYGLFKDEACTAPLAKENFADAKAVYSKVVTPYSMSEAEITAIPDQAYTGEAITPAVTVKYGDKELVKDTDYELFYENNINAGTATVTATGKGKYQGNAAATFDILSVLDATAVDDDITVQVRDENGAVVELTDGKASVKKGYSVVSNAKLEFVGVKPTEYLPDEDGNEYIGGYWYDFTKAPTANSVLVTHDHKLDTKTDHRLLMKCEWLVGSTFETIAHIGVNDEYMYGEEISIGTVVDSEKYGTVTFDGRPMYRNADTDSWDYQTRRAVGEYEVRVGAKLGETTYQLSRSFKVVQKDLGDMTAYVDLDGADTEYDEKVETALPTITYNGKEYTPTARLVYNNFWNGTSMEEQHALTPGTDYTVTVTPGKNAGTYTITFEAVKNEDNEYTGNLKGTKTVQWNIGKATMELGIEGGDEFVYNGANSVDESQFVISGVPENSSDAVFTYFKNGEAIDKPDTVGTYTVKATFTNPNYNEGEITKNFEIVQRDVKVTPAADQKITYGEDTPTNIAYTVEQATADGTTGLVEGDSISGELVAVDGTGLLNAGTYDYALTSLTNRYVNYNIILDDTNKFTVEKKQLTKDMFKVSDREKTYNKQEQSVTVTASDRKAVPSPLDDDYELPMLKELIAATDWEIVDGTDRATNAGDYVVKVKATEGGNYTGEVILDNEDQKWKIARKSVKDAEITVTVTNDNTEYTGDPITADVVVKYGDDTTLELTTDYTIDDNEQSITQTNAGTYKFKVNGEGNYCDTRDVEWTIAKSTDVSIEIQGEEVVIYDGADVSEDYAVAGAPEGSNYTYTYKWSADGGETWTDTAPINAGDYQVKAEAKDSTNYVDTEAEAISFTIAKRQAEVYPEEFQKWVYGTKEEDITIVFDVEKAEEGSVTGLVESDSADLFAGVLKIDGYGAGNAGYYDVVLDETKVIDNYNAVYNYPVQIEITRKQLTEDMFTITDFSNFVYDGNVKSADIIEAKDGDIELVKGPDYTTTGTFDAYTPGNYDIYIDGTGNYKGKATKTWSIASNTSVSARTIAESYTYNGLTPEVSVVANEGTELPEKSVISYKYYQKNGEDWTELEGAPVNAGTYKVQGVVEARGYEIEVAPAEFTIAQKEIEITLNAADLNGVYGESSYKVGYSYDETLVLDADKTEDFITGEVVIIGDLSNVIYDGDNIVGRDLDLSGIVVNNSNYVLVKPEGQKFFLSPRDIADADIQLASATVTLHDVGKTSPEFKVVINGTELVNGVDYDAAGTLETNTAGDYNVQVSGKGNYKGIALQAWSAVDVPEERAAAVKDISDNVTVTLSNPVSKVQGGKQRVSVDVTANADADKYTVTKTGLIYFNGAEGDYNADNLTIDNADNVNYFNVGKKGVSAYTYGMPDIGNGIYAVGYAIVNDGAYQTVKYTNVWRLAYEGESGAVIDSITLNKQAVNIGLGEEYPLFATITPSDANQSVTWSTSDESIASVDENGMVTGNMLGTAYITATAVDGSTAQCRIVVKKAPTSITLDKTELKLNVNSSYTFTKTLSANSAASFKWTTSDPDVARVYSTGKIVAQNPGTTVITVTTYNGKTASCVVTVEDDNS